MTQEQAYQLATKFFNAGKAGAPCPSIEHKQHEAACLAAYNAGKRYA